MTQSQLAEKSQLSIGMIGQIETSVSFPSISNIEKIAKALSIQPYQLFMKEDDRISFKTNEIEDFIGEIRTAITPFILDKEKKDIIY